MPLTKLKLQKNKPVLPKRLAPLTEEEIISGWKVRDKTPMVSICCATHNHADWIEDALCGFLAQETDFPFEIIVRDDASTDGTAEKLREYSARYPNLFRVVTHETNQYQLGKCPSTEWPSLAKGEYIALCEGDDFWTSKKKLQNQIDFIRQYPQASMCLALTHIFEWKNDVFEFYKTTVPPSTLEIKAGQPSFYLNFHTSTYLIDRLVFTSIIEKYWRRNVFDDTALRSFAITYGTFVVLPEVVSVYRVTKKGVYSSLEEEAQLKSAYAVFSYLKESLPGNHAQAQVARMYGVALRLTKLYAGNAQWGLAMLWGSRLSLLFSQRSINYLNHRLNSVLRSPWGRT